MGGAGVILIAIGLLYVSSYLFIMLCKSRTWVGFAGYGVATLSLIIGSGLALLIYLVDSDLHKVGSAEKTLLRNLLIAIVVSAGPFILALFRRRYLRPKAGYCRLCGYDLRASTNSKTCPECGTPFECDPSVTPHRHIC